MIIFFIGLGFLVIAIVSTIIYNINDNKSYKDYSSELSEVTFTSQFVGYLFGIIITVICGVAMIYNNSNYAKTCERIEIEEEITQLNNSYDALVNYQDNSITRLQINEYNAQVKDFKTKIQIENLDLNNYWINIFHSPVYKEYTGEEVKYI